MNTLSSITYNISTHDSSTTSTGKSSCQTLDLECRVTAKMIRDSCQIQELQVKGKNRNDSDMGSAEIKLQNSSSPVAPHNSDWLRAVARMFHRLADNMDQLPTTTQTIAQIVANKIDKQ